MHRIDLKEADMQMNKILQWLTSLFLSTLLALSSIPAIIAVQEPTDVYAEGNMTNNNMHHEVIYTSVMA